MPGRVRNAIQIKNAAMKYLDGRKKSLFSILFTEISPPPIPNQYKQHFTVHGALLPGYTLEGQVTEKSVSAPGRIRKPTGFGFGKARMQRNRKAAPPKAPDKKKRRIFIDEGFNG